MAFKTIKRELYGGEVELLFNPNTRNRYLVNTNGESFSPVGVTTVLNKVLAKEALMLWPMNMATGWLRDNCLDKVLTEAHIDEARKAYVKKSDKGKDVGSEVHEAIELQLKECLPHAHYDGLSPEAKKAVDAMADWIYEVKPKVLATEQIVYSREHNYCGTFDALLEIDGKVVLCDVKTTNASQSAPLGIYPENFLQLGAYSLAYKQELWGDTDQRNRHTVPGQPDDLLVVNASKTGKLSTLRASELGLSVQSCEAAWLGVLNTYKFLEPIKKQIKEWK